MWLIHKNKSTKIEYNCYKISTEKQETFCKLEACFETYNNNYNN